MITGIVVGILVLWTLYAEVQDRQIRRLTIDAMMRFTDRIEALEFKLECMENDVAEIERQQDAMWEHGSTFWSGGKAS